MNNFIFLMGMPGCGKSTFGKKLALKINYRFLDLDEYIENMSQTSINELFSEKGEYYFRNLESQYLNEIVAKNEKLVISLGGGTPCFNDNLICIKNKGTSIFLEAPLKLLADRIINALSVRPMFKNLDYDQSIKKLEELKKTRYIFYNQANITVNVVDLKLSDLIQSINKLNSDH